MSVQVSPSQVFTAANLTEFNDLKAYLDGIGYTQGSELLASRVDDQPGLRVTLTYPTWTLTV